MKKIVIHMTKRTNFNIQSFIKTYFTLNHCTVTEESSDILHVQLTKEMDLALMNRPFYWQYVESTGRSGEPMQVSYRLCQDVNETHATWIHFGSPQLHKMFAHLQQNAKITHLFEYIETTENTMLQPWLITNIVVTSSGMQRKEQLLSIGLNLINGMMILDMMEFLEEKSFKPTIANHCYTISPIIKLNSGYERIENYIIDYIKQQDHQWADKSIALLKEELQMIEHFFGNKKDSIVMKEKEDVMNRLQPNISIDILNGGLFYMQPIQV